MSVFGGDSWGREAQQRKRRVDDLVVEGLDGSSYRKLSSGKYACIVCPHNPILDSPLMLSMHCKGSRHRAAESRLKEGELMRRDEINKSRALSGFSVDTANSNTYNQNFKSSSKPLIKQTRKATSEILSKKTTLLNSKNENNDVKLKPAHVMNATSTSSANNSSTGMEASDKAVAQQHLDFRERRERELKFTAAGWKRDGHGKWLKDENVEFDSDEEDPNVCLG